MTDTIADDLLDGAEAIASFLGSKWNKQRVFNARHRGQLPIRSGAGMRLYAFKSELREALRAPERLKSEETRTDG